MPTQPSFAHLVIYRSKPEHVDDVIASMREVARAAAGSPGLLHIGPWHEANGTVIVALSVWESEEAFAATMPSVFAAVQDHDPDGDWDAAPPEIFRLVPPPHLDLR
jgi:heme-degrading monooxygenase HmoA